LATIITTTNLGALVEKPQNNDTVKYLVQQANPSASIQWNEITIGAISDTGVTLTPRTGSIYYTTTALSITWTIA
jgi:hypothetical protein